jgi:hypothetical protein
MPRKRMKTSILPAGSAPDGGKTKLLTLGDLDGRTRASKSAMAMVTAMEADLGGTDYLSAAQRALVRRAAVVTVLWRANWRSGLPVPASNPRLDAALLRRG